MKKGIFTIIAIVVLGLAVMVWAFRATQKVESILRVGTSADNRPYEYFYNEEIVGFDIDLISAVAEKLGKRIELIEMDFNNLIPAIQAGRLDVAIAAFTPTEERAKHVDFSDTYLKNKSALVSRKDQPFKNLNELVGKFVATQLGSYHETSVRGLNIEGLNIRSYNRVPEMIQEMKVKNNPRVSAIVIGVPEAIQIAKLNPELMYVEIPLSDDVAIVLPKGSALKEPINKILKELRKDGVLEALEHKWGLFE
jgi:arginine/lysine/histidine transporter system substrate-binding protein